MAVRLPTTRRDFLRAKGLPDATQALFERSHGARSATGTIKQQSARDSSSLMTASRRAMACQFQIAVPATHPRAVLAASSALDLIDQLESQMTVYDSSSDVSRINELAAVTPVSVERRLFDL